MKCCELEVEKKISIQIDYVQCHDCGEELEFTAESDSYGDIQITVEKCDCGEDE